MIDGKARLLIEGGVALLSFNDPATLNAIGTAMRRDLGAALDAIADPGNGARCLLLTGEGRAFCSGANLTEKDGDDRDAGDALRSWYNPTLTRLRDLPMPIIAAVNGPAAGIGMSFALSADLILAARSAYFLQAFTRIGLVPDGGATYMLPRRIGMARAMELSMLAERLPAETALAWGLINRVVDDGALPAEARALAIRLAAGPTRAYALLRQIYWRSLGNSHEGQLAAEADAQTEAGRTADFKEGVRAFIEKRPARFTGH
ncbi:MAG: enoyl-CoA hydratase/isomerase [Alphaproteobacteria bacterium]|nr:enoyl-CoA hydratase/isomerase [Alphaproteobacteria bacterium]